MGGRGPRLAPAQGMGRHEGCSSPRTRTKPTRARLKRKFKAEAAAPAAGKACDWLAPLVPSVISQDSLDPRSYRGHSLQLGHVFDAGGRALDRRIVFSAKCGAMFWERADALCRSCKQHPGGCASQLRKLRSGLFPNKRYPGWTVELIRRPTLDEADTLVAQLESCEAGLGRSVWGPTTPKKARVAPQAAELLHWRRVTGAEPTAEEGLERWGERPHEVLGRVRAQWQAGGQARHQGWECRSSQDTLTCSARSHASHGSAFGPNKSGTMCILGSDASASSDEEAPNICNGLLEVLLHAQVGAT